jgi:hypothetical protein
VPRTNLNSVTAQLPRTKIAVALLTITATCIFMYWMFRWCFDLNYLHWYVHAGPFIGLATAAFGAAWGRLDKNVGLVSANPLDYVGGCLQVIGLPIYVFGGHIRSKNQPRPLPAWEYLLVLPLVLVFLVAALGWLLLIAPIQYFVFLVCGAPSRIATASSLQVFAKLDGHKLSYGDQSDRDQAPKEWWDASMRSKPVTLANAFSAAALLLAGQFWKLM